MRLKWQGEGTLCYVKAHTWSINRAKLQKKIHTRAIFIKKTQFMLEKTSIQLTFKRTSTIFVVVFCMILNSKCLTFTTSLSLGKLW